MKKKLLVLLFLSNSVFAQLAVTDPALTTAVEKGNVALIAKSVPRSMGFSHPVTNTGISKILGGSYEKNWS